jgi:hypothetical protein
MAQSGGGTLLVLMLLVLMLVQRGKQRVCVFGGLSISLEAPPSLFFPRRCQSSHGARCSDPKFVEMGKSNDVAMNIRLGAAEVGNTHQATPEAPFQRSLYFPPPPPKRPRRLLPVASPPLPSQTSYNPKLTAPTPRLTPPFLSAPTPEPVSRPRTFRSPRRTYRPRRGPPIHSPTFPFPHQTCPCCSSASGTKPTRCTIDRPADPCQPALHCCHATEAAPRRVQRPGALRLARFQKPSGPF